MHSYSVEFVATIDNENTNNAIGFVNLMVWGPNDIAALQANGCFGPSTCISLTSDPRLFARDRPQQVRHGTACFIYCSLLRD